MGDTWATKHKHIAFCLSHIPPFEDFPAGMWNYSGFYSKNIFSMQFGRRNWLYHIGIGKGHSKCRSWGMERFERLVARRPIANHNHCLNKILLWLLAFGMLRAKNSSYFFLKGYSMLCAKGQLALPIFVSFITFLNLNIVVLIFSPSGYFGCR